MIARMAAFAALVVVAAGCLNAFTPLGGKVPLACTTSNYAAAQSAYCLLGRHMVVPEVKRAVEEIAFEMQSHSRGRKLLYLDASGRFSSTLWPHRSHGNGYQLDLALYYRDRDTRAPLDGPPRFLGYGAYDPRNAGEPNPCSGRRPADFGDPPDDRNWELDPGPTLMLIETLIARDDVERIFLAPHLAQRLGVSHEPKVRFAGCHAARHDDHIHVDFR